MLNAVSELRMAIAVPILITLLSIIVKIIQAAHGMMDA
jgi:hypothetical protein